MNEKIKELANEAGLPTYNPKGVPIKLEKFAELIIKDVLIIADNFELEVNHSGLVDSIKYHFGVE